jgi:hypothetical protein
MRAGTGRAYYDKKIGEGKMHNEVMRCLKRRLADHVWRIMFADERRAGTGPGGQAGATTKSGVRLAQPRRPALRRSHFPDPPPEALRRRQIQPLDRKSPLAGLRGPARRRWHRPGPGGSEDRKSPHDAATEPARETGASLLRSPAILSRPRQGLGPRTRGRNAPDDPSPQVGRPRWSRILKRGETNSGQRNHPSVHRFP